MVDFTIADVLAWARTKPVDGSYEYTSNDNCAMCQFLRETGRANQPEVLPRHWSDGAKSGTFSDDIEACLKAEHITYVDGIARCQDTFANLAKRLEALLPAEPLSDTWTKADAYLTDIEDVARERVTA